MRNHESQGKKPVVLYDGNCRFCCRQADRLRSHFGDSLEIRPADAPLGEIVLCEPTGKEYRAAAAVLRLFSLSGGWKRLPHWCYRKIPLMAAVCEAVYRLVARHRLSL